MIVGCYSLHVYCENPAHPPLAGNRGEFTGQTQAEATHNARKAGWLIPNRRGWGIRPVWCPCCVERAKIKT